MSEIRRHSLRLVLAGSLGAVCTVASAQDEPQVMLRSDDGRASLSGRLIAVENGNYIVANDAGNFEIPVQGVQCEGAACPVPAPSIGGLVDLVSDDDSIQISGTVTDFVDGNYVVETERFGILSVDSEKVSCTGDGCVQIQDLTRAQVLAGAATATQTPLELPTDPDIQPTTTAPAATPAPAAPATDGSDAKVRFAGSDTVGLGLMPFLLDDYADYLDANIDRTDFSETETLVRYLNASGQELNSLFVNSTGSGDAFDALETRQAELGMTSRPARDAEAQRMRAAGAGELRGSDNETVIAVDSLAVITHPTNPVTALTRQQIGDMYLGRITNWSEVGGPDAPITVLSREDGSSTRGVFENAIFDGVEPPLANRVTYPGGDNPEMAAAVRSDPTAIGYVGFSYSEGLNRLDLNSTCGIRTTATPFSVKTEEYPLGRRLYLYNRADNLPAEAADFLKYVLSPDADDAIAQSNFVNFAVERQPHSPSRQETLYRDLDEPTAFQLASVLDRDLPNWDRLSTTVRFPTGSSLLGNKELNDIERLIAYLADLPDDTRVAVVGFADSRGAFDFNANLSQRRAASVAAAISNLGGSRLSNIRFETKGYSELAPAVCNDSENGWRINRRVEIWVQR
ncbi:substrate-binding domain-containing protein [Yoonia sp. SS1-5]|uniref:Substrate-binding domain-containing protein n=1 Tax=Yoonia rhodophyticola TaxID=3137370 RepID=A0AAN0MF17_9RHOB